MMLKQSDSSSNAYYAEYRDIHHVLQVSSHSFQMNKSIPMFLQATGWGGAYHELLICSYLIENNEL